ncbi:MAG: hypothetical protein HY814_06745 [Candidatus Riflebacteria bacterium]|nr:hypothetical protein [Candidatus Riflebacteria bacterium]
MFRLRAIGFLATLGLAIALAGVCAGAESEMRIVLEHARPIDVAQSLSREFSALQSPVEIKTGERTGELIVVASKPIAAIIEQRARELDSRPAQAGGALLMEFAVIEEESDGAKHVIASPRVMSMPGQPAVVKVQGADRGLDLQVHPRKLGDGRVELGVACHTWRKTAGDKVSTRNVESRVVVASGKRITLQNTGDSRMSLELEVHTL